jgi:hypothetical protein
MEIKYFLSQLSVNSMTIKQVLEDITQEQSTWKPQASEWSILEVINHLLDEEKEDFRYRLNHLLTGNKKPWPRNDPRRWVVERLYNQREICGSIEELMDERIQSLE